MVGSMKWPTELTMIRHGQSSYNVNKEIKREDPMYQEFMKRYEQWESSGLHKDPPSHTVQMAREVMRRFPVVDSDANTRLTDEGITQARKTARALQCSRELSIPDVIYVSPYRRTMQTYAEMCRVWTQLANVNDVYIDERLRELDHGLATLYGDKRVYHVLHPEQARLHRMEGDYFYRYPNGENVPDVMLRGRSWRDTLIREHGGKHVLVIFHHIMLLAFRTDQERLGYDGFLRLDMESKPVNCGVTIYDGMPGGRTGNGVLKLREYNTKHY